MSTESKVIITMFIISVVLGTLSYHFVEYRIGIILFNMLWIIGSLLSLLEERAKKLDPDYDE